MALTYSFGSATQFDKLFATQLQADLNELTAEGTWTPAITFATPGDLTVVYSAQAGKYTKIGKLVIVQFQTNTSTFTHTTASGALQITGLPFVSENVASGTDRGLGVVSGITKAGYTQFIFNVTANVSLMTMTACGSGVGASAVTAADMPTGGSVIFSTTFAYRAAT